MKTTTAILLVVFSFVGPRPKQTVEGLPARAISITKRNSHRAGMNCH